MPLTRQTRASFTSILKANFSFSILSVIWLIIGGILLILSQQGDWVLYFSAHRTPFWDVFFSYGTKFGEEFAFLAALIILLFIRFRAALMVLLLGLVVIITSGSTKQIFHHMRPIRYLTDKGLAGDLTFVEGVHVNSGATSFPSGHTMAAFAVYTFLALNIRYKGLTGIVFFALAMMVGISRIYLVQHFLKDIYLGSIIGAGLAIYIYYLQGRLPNKSWMDKSLLTRKTTSA
jgi:membrane-associated phospholipid phosphatase